jgi:hypothetical protein
MLVGLQVSQAASPVNKCVVNGTVTFQSSPCSSDKPIHRPTIDELNAQRKSKLASDAAKPASAVQAPTPQVSARPTEPTPSQTIPDAGFRCDGRQHCSQMRSCREAKYFLANCPGVKMDGDRDGIPCEEQWCTDPAAR